MGGRCGKVVFVIGTLSVGGSETQLSLLARQLVKRGWSVSVFALEGGVLRDVLESEGVRVVVGGVGMQRPSRVLSMFRLATSQFRLTRMLMSHNPDVVHGFLPLTAAMAAIAGRVASVHRIIISKRSLGRYQEQKRYYRYLDRIANCLSDAVTANSVAVAQDTSIRDNYPISRIVVIPNGLELAPAVDCADIRGAVRSELGLTEDDYAIACVANLIPYKGHEDLVRAAALAAQSCARLKVFLIGQDRGIQKQLLEQAEEHGVSECITFLGLRDDVVRLLAGMDAAVLPSHEEGFSNALVEKLASGLPVIATDVGGNPEAISDLPYCYLVPPHSPEALASAIVTLVSNLPQAKAHSATRANAVRAKYSAQEMVDAYERLYALREGPGAEGAE